MISKNLTRLAIAFGLLLPSAVSAAELTEHQQLAHDIFKELIEINTTDSVGDNTAAARAMAARLIDAGFPEEDVRVIVPAERKGNLVARLRSPAPLHRPILLLAHLDVVEANPEDWTVPPFQFLERDGYYYGRGTTDDKDEAAIYTANMIRMQEEGYRPNRDIILALTADEEGGAHNGVRFLLAEHPELVDAAFVLNEGGGGIIQHGKRIANSVQAAEKVYMTFHLEVVNPGGHSSVPRKDNAIYQLAAALGRIEAYEFPVSLNEVTRAYFRQSASSMSPEEERLIGGLLKEPPAPEAVAYFAGIPAYNARLRTTCVATRLQAGHADNALPQRAQATVNCRILPGVDPASVEATLNEVVADDGVSITVAEDAKPSPPSPLTEEVMAPIAEITEAMWPGVKVVPNMSTGATDGLYFRNAGIPVYGVSGVFGDIDDVRAHGQDERIGEREFYDALEFLDRLVRTYTSD
ncbi:MAG: M20/M25/M40 family metallo-hydrolase [Pseudomonadales bacterium]|jgi:acetylornithine deacetylase/succinyl-diaminopimelate desuccinylase-like protein